jgi:mono/diheme cytochrome c family protein
MNMKQSIELATIVCFAALACAREDPRGEPAPATEQRLPTQQKPEQTQRELVARGKYLTTIGGCHDCHSPKIMTDHGPEPDPDRLLSGHPANAVLPESANPEWISFSMDLTGFVGPWGVSYSANLTPDETGIGNWSYAQFETAIRKGKYKGIEGGRDLLPPMPWQMYKNFTDDDLKAVFTYLKSLKPVKNLVPPAGPRQTRATTQAGGTPRQG